MRAILTALILVMGAGTCGIAQEGTDPRSDRRTDLKRLVDDPDVYLRRKIRVPSIPCVDNPKGGYVCMKSVGGQMLRIQAEALGTRTDAVIAERLLGDCKGTANLRRAACRVDADLEPSNGKRDVTETPGGSMPITTIEAPDIDMYPLPTPRRNRSGQLPDTSQSRAVP